MRWKFSLAGALLIVSVFLSPALALEQLAESTFANNWPSQNTPFNEANPLNNFIRFGGYMRGDFKGPGGPGWKRADGYIRQKFPKFAKNSPTNVEIRFSIFEPKPPTGGTPPATTDNGTLDFSGTITDVAADAVPLVVFWSRSKTYTNYNNVWEPLTAYTTLAACGADKRWINFIWKLSLFNENNRWMEARIDNIYLNMSPCGLTAAEAGANGISLNWDDSQAQDPPVPQLRGANSYQVYRCTDGVSWLPIGFSNTSDYLDLTPNPPDAETIYYCVTDFDTTNFESPKSPSATCKPARIVIDEVKCAYDSVTIGQTAIVQVDITNMGDADAQIDTLTLDFEGPVAANYLPPPPVPTGGLPIALPAGQSKTIDFSVTIDATSVPGLESINAQATGVGLGRVPPNALSDLGAAIKKPWRLRDPAILLIDSISAPGTVYCGQQNVRIYITVLNDGGENAGEWVDSQMRFVPGNANYTGLVTDPAGALPVQITAGNTFLVRYTVDVDPGTAPGVCQIDARIKYRDINLQQDVWTNFADVPGTSWNVVAGVFDFPGMVAVDPSGNIYAADSNNHRIQKFTSDGAFILKWGSNGPGIGQFDSPQGLAVDSSGNVYVIDRNNHRIQKFTSTGDFISIWGTNGTGDGEFNFPMGISIDSTGRLFVVDTGNNRVQRYSSSETLEMNWGSNGSGNGQFNNPEGIAVDSSGNVYVADTGNNRIQKFTSNGTFITTWGTFGFGDGEFNSPKGISIDSSGTIFVVDSGNNRIQKFLLQ